MIFYFSSTGNNKYVATRIAEMTGDSIRFIPDCLDTKDFTCVLKPGENFGLVIPTYFGGFPTIVVDFLSQLKIQWSKNNYTFFIGTYGAGAGNICKEAVRRFRKLGKNLDASFTIKMVDNWNPYFDMTDQKYISDAETNAESVIASVVAKVSEHAHELNSDKGMQPVIQAVSTAYYHKACSTKNFSVSGSCIGCGLCERQCPVHAIKLIRDRRPQWIKPKCTLCLGCVHRCPKNAIAYTSKTIGHGQYFNPNVKPDRR